MLRRVRVWYLRRHESTDEFVKLYRVGAEIMHDIVRSG